MSSSGGGFPVLYELSTETRHSLRDTECFLVGRNPAANLILLDVSCSRQQFRIIHRGGQFVLEPLSATVPTRCDGRAASTPTVLRHEMVIEAGASRFRFLEHEPSVARPAQLAGPPVPAGPLPPRPSAAAMRTMVGAPVEGAEGVVAVQPVVLSGQMLIGRDSEQVQIVLPHTRVSRVHARIVLQQRVALLSDLHSANGTFLNGRRVARPTVVRPNDRIDIGPYALVFDGQALLPCSRVDNVELVCWNLRRVVKDAATGQPLTLLDNVSLVVRPGEFVCVLGPSGSGKSTLLSALSARTPVEEGHVTINGQDFFGNFDALKHDVAVVPQHVALHDALPLQTALLYTARLRLPPDTSARERRAIISDMLSTVGLTERRDTKIRDLSGGQLKRASLANEILSRPNLLFLDEVTSGLDEQTDREMMRLFREIANTGKTILCVTHSSANVEGNCNLVVVLASSGKLAFVGSPAEALSYFGIGRLGEVYDRLSERQPEQWQTAFLQHELYRQYVQKRLPVNRSRDATPAPRNPPRLSQQAGAFARQAGILARRYSRLQVADLRSLGTFFGQCLLVALLLVIFYGNLDTISLLPKKAAQCGNLVFLLGISCLWFGCNNAAKEIVKERVIYLRERDVSVMIPSYYFSKLFLLGLLCLSQTTLLLGIVKYLTNLPGGFFGQWLSLAILSLVGVSLGLLISAMSKTTDNAVAMVPAALLPQIILAGVIAPVEGFAKLLAQLFISAYWGYRALAAPLPEDISKVLGADDWSAPAAILVLLLHLGVFVAAAISVLFLGDRRASPSTARPMRT